MITKILAAKKLARKKFNGKHYVEVLTLNIFHSGVHQHFNYRIVSYENMQDVTPNEIANCELQPSDYILLKKEVVWNLEDFNWSDFPQSDKIMFQIILERSVKNWKETSGALLRLKGIEIDDFPF